MTEEKKYNGWSNYETWNINLWLTNDQGTEAYINDLAQTAIDNAEADKDFTKKEDATTALSESIQQYIEENNPLAEDSSLYSDLLTTAIQEADFYEIAEAWLSEFDIEEDEEEDETEEPKDK